MQGTPWEPVPGRQDGELKSRVIIRQEDITPIPETSDDAPTARRFYIKRKDVIQYGATPGCRGCEAALRGEEVSRNHTEECRDRITGEIEKAEAERTRKVKERIEE